MNVQCAVPVKYMVVDSMLRDMMFTVIDTSMEGQGKGVAWTHDLLLAHKICAAMNKAEGYEYYSKYLK